MRKALVIDNDRSFFHRTKKLWTNFSPFDKKFSLLSGTGHPI